MRREKATLLQTFAAVLFATLFQLGIMLSFSQIIDQLPGMSYSALAVLEMFVVWQLSVCLCEAFFISCLSPRTLTPGYVEKSEMRRLVLDLDFAVYRDLRS